MLSSLIRQWFRQPAPSPVMDGLEELPYHDRAALVDLITRKAQTLKLRAYVDWPALVHMETIAICNAACGFCPYPQLERKGEKMSDALIEKIIDDLTAIPRHVPFQLAPYKVSDPFLEARLFDILQLVNAKLPSAAISIISNGSPLTSRKIDQLASVRNLVYLSLSLNYDNAQEYEAVMGIPFARTIDRLDVLHRRVVTGQVRFPVRVTRVSDDRDSDLHFCAWVRERYPHFKVNVLPRNDWIGDKADESAIAEVPDAPCHRWFDLSITATGKVAMCCMDGQARYSKGDVRTQHVLDIYNQPWLRDLRQGLVSRLKAGDPCHRCTYLSY